MGQSTRSPTSLNSCQLPQICLRTASLCSTGNPSNLPLQSQSSNSKSHPHYNYHRPTWSHKSPPYHLRRHPPLLALPRRPRRSQTSRDARRGVAKHLLSRSSEIAVSARSASAENIECWSHTTARVWKTHDVQTRIGMLQSWKESEPSCFAVYKFAHSALAKGIFSRLDIIEMLGA